MVVDSQISLLSVCFILLQEEGENQIMLDSIRNAANEFTKSLFQLRYVFKTPMLTAETWKWAAAAKPQPFDVFSVKQLLEQQ